MGLITPSSGRKVSTTSTSNTGRNAKESRWAGWANTGFNKSIKISDWAGQHANNLGSKLVGGERFWPTSGDYVQELEKAVRILNGFTQQGFVQQEEQPAAPNDASAQEVEETVVVGKDGKPLSKDEAEKLPATETRVQQFKKKVKKVNIVRKIPPVILQRACGIAIYSAMRTGIAPLGGSGGSGVVLQRLPDGSWSAPSFITPQNLSVGLMLGFDVYDVILLIMQPQAMAGFLSHKVTLGAETAVAAGPVGTGASMDISVNGGEWNPKKMSPIFSYVRSRGAYAGAEAMAQALVTRVDENERVYHWPSITGRDILTGRVRKLREAQPLYDALAAAETGQAQATPSDLDLPPELAAELGGNPSTAGRDLGEEKGEHKPLELDEGEALHLPPTPEQLAMMEKSGVKDDEDKRMEANYKQYVWGLPAPPRHPEALKLKAGIDRTKAGNRFVAPGIPGQGSAGPSRFTAPPPPTKASASEDLPPGYTAGRFVAPPEKQALPGSDEAPPLLPGSHPSGPYLPPPGSPPPFSDGQPTDLYAPHSEAPALPSGHPSGSVSLKATQPGDAGDADGLPGYSAGEDGVRAPPEKSDLAPHPAGESLEAQGTSAPEDALAHSLAGLGVGAVPVQPKGEKTPTAPAAQEMPAPGARRGSLHLGQGGDELDDAPEELQTRQEIPFSAAPTPAPLHSVSSVQTPNPVPVHKDEDEVEGLIAIVDNTSTQRASSPTSPSSPTFPTATPASAQPGPVSPTSPTSPSIPTRPERSSSRTTPLTRPPRSAARTPSLTKHGQNQDQNQSEA